MTYIRNGQASSKFETFIANCRGSVSSNYVTLNQVAKGRGAVEFAMKVTI